LQGLQPAFYEPRFGRFGSPGYQAVVVGSGPNGLAAAVALARAGRSVLVLEAAPEPGGGARSASLTLSGITHDVCAAVLPMAAGSPFFRSLPLAENGLAWIHPPLPLAHPLDDGTAAVLARSIDDTARGLGDDGAAWRRLFGRLADRWDLMVDDLLGPPLRVPAHPVELARFGLRGAWPASALARRAFRGEKARALFAGLAAHSILPLEKPLSAAFGLVLGAAGHAVGWPIARGGTQAVVDALVRVLRSLGGEVATGVRVERLDDLPPARSVLLDLTPRQVLAVAGGRLAGGYRRRLERYRYGPGVFKIDVALDGPVPWTAPECAQAGTLHLGGTLAEIAAGEAAVWRGVHPERPFVLAAQPSLFDPTRAPPGRHTFWAYCHVPNGSQTDMTDPILRQVERFAPGFRARILALRAMDTVRMEAYNANYVGGDINGGAQHFDQLFGRPAWRRVPYATPAPGLYICSSATPPGGGVHGMCGYWAAQAVLRGRG
jgi:phytoene dehydrogenase-like protein